MKLYFCGQGVAPVTEFSEPPAAVQRAQHQPGAQRIHTRATRKGCRDHKQGVGHGTRCAWAWKMPFHRKSRNAGTWCRI